ncbi:MAG: OmpA family protein, partial [Myxococcales bacterium]
SALFALTLAGLAGTLLPACAEDLGATQTQWTQWVAEHSTAAKATRVRFNKLAGEAAKLTPVGAAVASRDHLSVEMKRVGADVDSLEGVLLKGQDVVTHAAEYGKNEHLKLSIADVDRRWQSVNGRLETDLKALETEFGALQRLNATETTKVAAAAAAATAAQGTVYDARRLSHQGGSFDLGDIAFKKGKAEIDTDKAESKAELDRLVALFKTCDDFKADLVGHSDKSGDSKRNEKVSEERAQAVRKYLIEKGVKDTQLGKVTGVGGREPLVDEPDPDSEAEKKMDPKALDAARVKNRRITLKVTGTCK